MKRFLFVALFIIQVSYLSATVKLPALVGDNMVLQRNSKINLWGWAEPGEKVSVQFQGKQFNTVAGKGGKWMVDLPSFPAGGPYEMVVKGTNTISIQNILIGEVWLASGQSNMEMALSGINNAKQEIESANFPQIRLFEVKKKFAFQSQQDIPSDGWKPCSPATVDRFSAVAYLFGRELYNRYKVPIGLIHSSWGGTPAETWTSAAGLKVFPEFAKKAERMAPVTLSEFEKYKAKKDAWLKEFGKVDRGRGADGSSWADMNINTSDWATMNQPKLWSDFPELKGYNGTVWFRQEISIPAATAGKSIEISLGSIVITDSAFFNGKFIGTTTGFEKKRTYTVPGELVKAGANVISLRINGFADFGGMVGAPEEMFVKIGEERMTLAGEWLYKSGPDLSTLPYITGMTDFVPMRPQAPAVLYNAMIAPLIPYSIKGVIWYQGESNADNVERSKQYASLFPALIKDWRKQWGYDFPFLFVQLAGYQPNKPEPADYPWAYLREAQYKTLALPNTGMATAIDIGNEKDIHPKNKQDVAHRLALTALKVAYKENVVYSGPTFKSMKVEGDRLRLTFDNIGSGLWLKDKNNLARSFAIASKDKKFIWAKVIQEGNNIILFAEDIKHPVAVRYNWCNTPDGNLYNKENMPAVPFRTDDW